METNLEKSKRLFYKKIKEYPEMTMDRQGFIIGMLELAAKPDTIKNETKKEKQINYIKTIKN